MRIPKQIQIQMSEKIEIQMPKQIQLHMPKQIQIQIPKQIQTHNSFPHLAADILPDQTLLCRVCKQNYVASLPWTYFAKEGGGREF